MQTLTIEFKRLDARAIIPARQSPGASGYDLYSIERGYIGTQQRKVFRTGLAIAIPPGYEGQVRSRSGLAMKYGVIALNSPGTIDSDYRGEVKVILLNTDLDDSYTVEVGDRIAQLVFLKVEHPSLCETLELTATQRAANGLGSTGK